MPHHDDGVRVGGVGLAALPGVEYLDPAASLAGHIDHGFTVGQQSGGQRPAHPRARLPPPRSAAAIAGRSAAAGGSRSCPYRTGRSPAAPPAGHGLRSSPMPYADRPRDHSLHAALLHVAAADQARAGTATSSRADPLQPHPAGGARRDRTPEDPHPGVGSLRRASRRAPRPDPRPTPSRGTSEQVADVRYIVSSRVMRQARCHGPIRRRALGSAPCLKRQHSKAFHRRRAPSRLPGRPVVPMAAPCCPASPRVVDPRT